MEEIWKEIKGYPNYMVSNFGRVKSLNYRRTGREEILNLTKDSYDYLTIGLHKNHKQKNFKIHRLVAMAFIPIPEHLKDIPIDKLEVGHLKTLPNGLEDKTANEVWNIAWMSKSENQKYGTVSERRSKAHTNNPQKSKIVFQYDLDGKFIREFPSASEVQRQLGYSQAHISKCCNGKLKQIYGYIWKYAS